MAGLLRCLFGVGGTPSGGGAAAGGRSPPARCRASPAAGMFRGRGLWPRPRNAAAPDGRSVGRYGGVSTNAKAASCIPPGNRRWADGGMLTRGRREALGCAGGAAAFGGRGPTGPPACQTKERRPGQRPGPPLFQGASRPRRPPRGNAGIFSALSDKTPVFPPLFYEQNQRAAPDERPAGIIRWKPGKVIQLVFPRFFQKRQGGGAERRQWRKKRGGSPVSKGVEGSRLGGDAQRPLRTARGAEPPTGSRGGAPGGIRGGAPAPDPVS